jgi:hypothetical protein
LVTAVLLSPQVSLAILPLGDEQNAWSDMLFSSASGSFDSGGFILTTGAVPVELELGSQFGPTNPGWHYGTTGTLGGTFSAGLNVLRLFINPDGTLKNGDSLVTLSYEGGSPGSLGSDYGIGLHRTLVMGTVQEVRLDAAGDNTLDILYRITGGDLQELPNQQAPLLGKFAPGNVGLIRITAPNLPSSWSSNFNFAATSVHDFGLVPEPGTCLFAGIAAFIIAPARSRRLGTPKVAA